MEVSPEQMAEFEKFQAFQAAQAAEAKAAEPASYYVHLANGGVVQLSQEESDAAGTHYDGVEIIARYQVGA